MADSDGWGPGLIQEIEDFRSDKSIFVPRYYVFKETSSGRQDTATINKGWYVKVCRKDKYTNWILFAEIKESNPIEVAESAISFKNGRGPAFNW